MNYPLPPTSISDFDPQYSLKYFLRNLLIKIELLQDMLDLLSGTGTYTRPPIQHDRNCPLRRHLDLHSDHLTNLANSYEEMMRKLSHVNSRLLNDVVACARWELPASMLDPEVARDCAHELCELAIEAVDMDDHSGFDGIKGRCIRLREILRKAAEILTHIDNYSNLCDVEEMMREIGAHMQRLPLR